MTDPNQREASFGYDPAGNVVTKGEHGGSCPGWPIAYPPNLDPGAGCTVMGYDGADQLTSILYSDPATPDVASITYDKVGRRTAMTDTSDTSAWTWDWLGRLKTTTPPSGAANQVAYATKTCETRSPAPGANGYWKLEKPMANGWQPIDPSTMRPGSRPETHIPFPPGPR